MRTMTVRSLLAVAVLGGALFVGGCGQDIKRENEQLKAQVTTLQKENADLKSQIAAAKAEADKTKQDLDTATKEWQAKIDELQQMLSKRGPSRAPARR